MVKRSDALLGAALAVATLIAFAPVARNDFVTVDDPQYVTQNLHVLGGLTAEGLRWAFTATDELDWMPLTWLSHMLDVELFGLDPGAHHLVSVVIHASAAVLLFAFLRLATGAMWTSAFAAALFSLHPLRVESVAWAAERQDVLALFFGMATLVAYAAYARHGGWRRYLLVALFFSAGLLSKSMLVTLPCALLLLDLWPLQRWRRRSQGTDRFPARPIGQLLLEKLPLLALCVVRAGATWQTHSEHGAASSFETMSLTVRAQNSVLAYVAHLRRTVWPDDLSLLYPHPGLGLGPGETLPYGPVIAAALLLVALTALALLALRFGRRYPVVGWLWFIGTLVPMIGLVQVGLQGSADHYAYLPSVGLVMIIAFGARDVVASNAARLPRLRTTAGVLAGVVLTLCAVLTWRQASLWRDSRTLFMHVVEVSPEDGFFQNALGKVLLDEGEPELARERFEIASSLWPEFADARDGLGVALFELGDLAGAQRSLETALRLGPSFDAHVHLADVLRARGDGAGAMRELTAAIALEPERTPSLVTAADSLRSDGLFAESIVVYQRILAAAPELALAHHNLALAYAALNDGERALVHLARSIECAPDFTDAHYNLGLMRLASGRLDLAIESFARTLELDAEYADARVRLGEALFHAGQAARAFDVLTEALTRSPENARAQHTLGLVARALGNGAAAVASFERALEAEPESPRSLVPLAWILATWPDVEIRNGARALALAERSALATHDTKPNLFELLAAAHAELGDFDSAIRCQRQALDLAGGRNTARINERLRGYEADEPLRRTWN